MFGNTESSKIYEKFSSRIVLSNWWWGKPIALRSLIQRSKYWFSCLSESNEVLCAICDTNALCKRKHLGFNWPSVNVTRTTGLRSLIPCNRSNTCIIYTAYHDTEVLKVFIERNPFDSHVVDRLLYASFRILKEAKVFAMTSTPVSVLSPVTTDYSCSHSLAA